MNRKKIILIALVIILIIVGLVVYFFYFQKKKTETPVPNRQEVKISKVSDEKMYFPFLSEDNATIYYLKKDGDKGLLAKYSLKTNKIDQIVNTEINYPFSVVWSPKNDQAIIQADKYKIPPKILNSSGILNYLYRINNAGLKSLDPNIIEAVFSPDGIKIIYQYSDQINKISNISLSNPDGLGWEKLFDADYYDSYNLFWIDKNYFLYFVEPTAPGSNNPLYKYDLINNQPSEIGEITNLMPNKIKLNLIYEFTKDKKLFLGTMKMDGSDKKELNLENSLEKIAILPGGDEIIAAIGNGENNSDTFYKVNLDSGEKTELNFQNQDKIQAFNLMATNDGKTVYFTSEDNLLYKLDL